MQRGINPPTVEDLMQKYQVNLPGRVEAIWQPLYDYQASVAAATTSQLFFQTPVGQSSKTLADTNMTLAGNIPAGQRFAITGIQVEFWPDLPIETEAAANQYADDVLTFYKSGNLVLTIGSKPYIQQGKLIKFPPVNRLGGFAGAATGNAVDQSYLYAAAAGREYSVRQLVLQSSQNFSVDIQNRAAVSTTGVIGVTLNGWLFRNAQ